MKVTGRWIAAADRSSCGGTGPAPFHRAFPPTGSGGRPPGGVPGDGGGGVDGLEGNSNSGTTAACLMQLRGRYSGPLKVVWDNTPAHRGEAVRECLAVPSLGIQLANPRFHEGRLCRATARTSTPMRRSGAESERRPPGTCDWEPRHWCRRGSTTSPDRPLVKGRRTPAKCPAQFPTTRKCTSQLGFSLGLANPLMRTCDDKGPDI